jgi:hypothetical protein
MICGDCTDFRLMYKGRSCKLVGTENVLAEFRFFPDEFHGANLEVVHVTSGEARLILNESYRLPSIDIPSTVPLSSREEALAFLSTFSTDLTLAPQDVPMQVSADQIRTLWDTLVRHPQPNV